MVNFGNGFTWSEVYFMPVHWRRFYFKKLVEAKKKEKEEYDKINKKGGARGPNVRVRK
jgi:undecaprenyl pyrophosphate synthase